MIDDEDDNQLNSAHVPTVPSQLSICSAMNIEVC